MTCAVVLSAMLCSLAAGPPSRDPAAPISDPRLPPSAPRTLPAPSPDHPLTVPLKLVRRSLAVVDQYGGHQAVLIKREHVDGRLSDYAYIAMKIRHKPMSVYTRYLAPPGLQGREAIYVEGKNDGKLLGHGTGLESLIGTLQLDPNGAMAMQDNRHPITMAGVRNLMELIIRIGEKELAYGECEVKYFDPARIDGKACLCVEIRHPVKRDYFECHLTRLFFEKATDLLIRVEQYDWPEQPGGEPVLLGEYTFTRVQLTNALTDLDFDPRNPAYDYAESGE